MNGKEFYAEFVKRTAEDTIWRGRSYREIYKADEVSFTELVNKHIIHGILRDGGYRVQHEYFRVDTIGWQEAECVPPGEEAGLGLNRHFWNLLAAVEHENNPADWADELIKLAHLRCPLKVVVGYTPCDRRADDLGRLGLAAGWMRGLAAYDPRAGEEYLAILGNSQARDRGAPGYESFDYRGYLYDYEKEAFVRI